MITYGIIFLSNKRNSFCAPFIIAPFKKAKSFALFKFNKGGNMPNKLQLLDTALKSIYFAGDTSNAKLLFLASLTRFSKKPVSVIIKGASGSGKRQR